MSVGKEAPLKMAFRTQNWETDFFLGVTAFSFHSDVPGLMLANGSQGGDWEFENTSFTTDVSLINSMLSLQSFTPL